MSRNAWIALTAGLVVAVGVGVGALVAAVRSTDSGSTSPPPTASTGFENFSLPLLEDSSTLALAGHDRNLLVGIAAQPSGPVEIAALRAEKPLPTDALRIAVDGQVVEAESCGTGCSRLPPELLSGRQSFLTVRAGSSEVAFALPALLPADGTKVFARAQRTMGALRSFRFTERLSSGRRPVITHVDVQAPDRLRLRTTGGYRSVLIGRRRWDYQGSAGWERGQFSGLNVADALMWFRATHPRVLSRSGGVWRLAAFGLQPVPAWFRIDVAPSGRVLQAEMLAPSHFMLHRYRDFNGAISITPPVRK